MRVLIISTIYLSVSFSSGLIAQDLNPDSLFSVGHDFYAQAKYEKAAVTFDNASSVYLQDGDSLKWINSKIYEADAWMNSGQVQKGLELLLATKKHIPINATINLKASLEETLGRIYRELEQYEKSIQHYLDSIKFANASKDSVFIATLNNNISYPYLYSGDYERAFTHQKKAKEIYESTGEVYRLSFVLNGMFLTLRDLGLHAQAEHYIRQSMAIREEIGKPNLLDVSYHNMALSFNDMGKPDSAIIYYRKSLELSRELGNPYDITQTLINIGELYERSGDYDNALAYYNEALETNYQTERPVSIANNLKRLAEVAIQNDDLTNAESFYREALTWLEKANTPQDLASLYLNIAELKLEQGNYTEAKKYVADAKKISRENFTAQQYHANNVLGEIYKAEGKLHESLAKYRRAYDLYSNRGISFKITPAMNLARAYSEVHSDSAFTFAEEAFTLIDSIRTNVAGLTFRSGFFRDYADFYNEVASWHITQKNDPEKAFELIESAKARVLMDELFESQEKVYETLDEATLIKKQQKAKQIDRLYNKLAEADTEEEKSAVKNELKDLEFDYQSFLNEIQASTPQLKNFEYPRPVSAIQARDMLDSKTAILEYAFAGNNLVRILITQDDISAIVVDSIRSTDAQSFLMEQVNSFGKAITDKTEIADIKQLGSTLHEVLIPNFKSSGIYNLLIVSDGPLSFLPFEALSQKGRYYIEDFNIKYIPSVSIYPFINAPHRLTETDLLAVAGSGFEGAEVLASTTRSKASLASLPSTLLEVDSIAVNFPNAKILKNEDVTETTLKSFNLGDFRFIHFATHAFANEITPSQSGLLLSRKTEVESLFGEDGYLNSREISGLKLNADLVTLSACNTGLGKVVTGEGLLGLQRSFLSAGASSVIVSLWSIYDRSTSQFMSDFYNNLLTYQNEDYGLWSKSLNWLGFYQHPLFDYKSRALQTAKINMINHPYYSHPVHWAPFILIGK